MSASTQAAIIRSKGAEYRGRSVPQFDLDTSLFVNPGKRALDYDSVLKADNPGLKAQLYERGRDRLVLKRKDALGLPEADGAASELVYNDCQRRFKEGDYAGTWHMIMRVLEKGAKINGHIKGDGYRAVIAYQNVEAVEKKGNEWEVEGDNVNETLLWIPPEGIIVPYGVQLDFVYNHFGLPEETADSEHAAIAKFVEMGFTAEQAKNELSSFYWSEGLRAMLSDSGDRGGPLCVDLDFGPGGGGGSVGSFAAGSIAERSEAEPGEGIFISTGEYMSLQRDRETLQAITALTSNRNR